MKLRFQTVFLFSSLLLCGSGVRAQHLSFRYLGPEQGMRALASSECVIDDFGHIWITTLDGLVRYNGSLFSFYTTTTHPELPTNEAGRLYCDSRNHIWFGTSKGLVLIDHHRRLHRLVIDPADPDRPVQFAFENVDGSITAISQRRAFTSLHPDGPWEAQPWLDTLLTGTVRSIKRFHESLCIIFIPSKGLMVIDTREKKLVFSHLASGITAVEGVDDRFIYMSHGRSFNLLRIDLQHPDTVEHIPNPAFVAAPDLRSEIQDIVEAADGNLYMTTTLNGLIRYDPVKKEFAHFKHDPTVPYSIPDDRWRKLSADARGNIAMIGLLGATYTNVYGNGIEYFRLLKTTSGQLINSRVASLAEDDTGLIWFTTDNGVLTLDPVTRQIDEIHLKSSSSLYARQGIPYFVAFDGHEHIWVTYHGAGIALFDLKGRHVRDILNADYPAYPVALDQTRIIRKGEDGWMYIGTSEGLFRMNPHSFAIDTFIAEPALSALLKVRVVDILQRGDVLWVATSPGGAAWKYNFTTKKLDKFTTDSGLISHRVYSLGLDQNGIALVGTYKGLSMIFPDGSIQNFEKGNGIPGTRIESIQQAKDGSIWLTNSYNLLKYDVASRQFKTIVGEPVLSDVGFQIVSSAALSSGHLAFGVHKGLILVEPDVDQTRHKEFEVMVFYKNAEGDEILCDPDIPLRLPMHKSNVQFDIGITNIVLADKMMYRFRLNGRNEGAWSEPSSNTQLFFNLTPGKYALEVEAYRGDIWIKAPGTIHIHMPFPWWQRWWVIALSVLALMLGIGYIIASRIRKYKAELSLARQINELESKAIRAQMNPHFVFNSLNAIQECIVTGKIDEAYMYLSKFSRLLRMVLEHSDVTEVSLNSELEVLGLYVSLEKLRFHDELEFILEVDEGLDDEEIFLPPMLIQPHLENAIWHGLRHQDGEKKLRLKIDEVTPGYLDVIVEDNGVGRIKSKELQQAKIGLQQHKSKGTSMSSSRMSLLSGSYPLTHFQVSDITLDDGAIGGTRVIMRIPILKKSISKFISSV